MRTDDTVDLDRIERAIDIDAPVERVYELASRPGWWINDGEIDPSPDLTVHDDQVLLTHPKWGTFRLGAVDERPPHYVAFRWLFPDDEIGTLVEFFVDEGPGGVTLRVVESGFDGLGKSPADLRRHVTENTSGWEDELAAARRHVAGHGA